jgi:hypothetical protein
LEPLHAPSHGVLWAGSGRYDPFRPRIFVALATVHEMDFLLTWNCTHIANAAIRLQIEDVCRSSGYRPPVICTPLELLDGEEEEP